MVLQNQAISDLLFTTNPNFKVVSTHHNDCYGLFPLGPLVIGRVPMSRISWTFHCVSVLMKTCMAVPRGHCFHYRLLNESFFPLPFLRNLTLPLLNLSSR